jgi:hypothetical protein
MICLMARKDGIEIDLGADPKKRRPTKAFFDALERDPEANAKIGAEIASGMGLAGAPEAESPAEDTGEPSEEPAPSGGLMGAAPSAPAAPTTGLAGVPANAAQAPKPDKNPTPTPEEEGL